MPRKNSITTRSGRSNIRKSPVANSKTQSKDDEKRKTRQSLHKSPQIELSPFSIHPQSIPSPSLFTRSKIQKGQSPKVIYSPASNDRLTRSKEKNQRKSSDSDTQKKFQTTPASLRSKRNSRAGDEAEDKTKLKSPQEQRLTRSGKRTRSSNEQLVLTDDSDTPAKRRRTRLSHASPLTSDSLKTSSNSRKSTNSESPRKKPSPSKSAKRTTTTRRSGGNKTKTVTNDESESSNEEEEEEEEDDDEEEEEEEEEVEDEFSTNVNKSDKKGKSQSSVSVSGKKTTKSAVNDKKLVKNVKNIKKSPVKMKSKARRRSTPVSTKRDFTVNTSQMSSSLSRTRSRSRGRHEKPVNDLKLTPHVTKGRRSTQRSEPSHRESSGQRRSTPSRNTRRAQKPQKSKKMPPDQPSRQSKDEEERMEEGSCAEQEASEDGTKSIDMEAEGETKTAPEKEQHVDEDKTINECSPQMEEDKEDSNKRKRIDDNSAENSEHENKKPKLEQEEELKATDDKPKAESEPKQDEKTESPVENVVDSVIKSVEKTDSRASVITSSTATSETTGKDAVAVQEKETEQEEKPSLSKPEESATKEAVDAPAADEKSVSADNKKPDVGKQTEEPVKSSDEQDAVKKSSEQVPIEESSEAKEKETVAVEEEKKESINEIDNKVITKEKSDGKIEPNCLSKKAEVEADKAVSSASVESESKDPLKEDNSSASRTTENEQEEKTPSDASKQSSAEVSVDAEADKSQGSALGQDQASSEMDAELRLSETNSSASHSELETSLEKGDDSTPTPLKESANSSEHPAKDSEELKMEEKPPMSPTMLMSTSDSKESPEAMDVDNEIQEKSAAKSESNETEMEVDVDDSNTSKSDAVKTVPDNTSDKNATKEKESDATDLCTKTTKTESEKGPVSESNSRLLSDDKDSSKAPLESAESLPETAPSSTIPPNKEAVSTGNEKNTEEGNSSVSSSIEQNSEEHIKKSDDAVIKQAPDARDTSTDAITTDKSADEEVGENKSEPAGVSVETSKEQVKDTVAPKVSEKENVEQNGAQSETCDKNEIGANSQNPPVSETGEEHKKVDRVNSPKSNGVSVESVELDMVSATAGGTLTRKFVYNSLLDSQTMEAANEKKFAVVSYNLQGLEGVKSNHENLLNELKQLEPSILCVQDVDAPYFEDTLQPSLKGLGYSGIYRKNKVAEKGLATMYLTSVFEALDHNALDVHDLVQKDIENSGLEGNEKEALSSYLDHSLFVLYTKLRSLSSQKCICICNASFPAEDLSLHALQIAVTVRELTNQSEGSGNPHILCGTFNMEDSCPGYQILKDGYLSNEMIEDLQGRKNVPIPNKENAALVNLLWKCFQHPSSNLKSSYNIVVGDDTNTSRNLHSSKDSVWFSSDSLQLLGVLDTSELTSETNKNVHLSLKAHFSFVN